MVKSLPTMWETWVRSLGWEDPLEKHSSHSSILAWEIPWTEEPGRLYSSWGRKKSDTTQRLTQASKKTILPSAGLEDAHDQVAVCFQCSVRRSVRGEKPDLWWWLLLYRLSLWRGMLSLSVMPGKLLFPILYLEPKGII